MLVFAKGQKFRRNQEQMAPGKEGRFPAVRFSRTIVERNINAAHKSITLVAGTRSLNRPVSDFPNTLTANKID
jgi:hypothetical protein